jgi:hypothetical protein
VESSFTVIQAVTLALAVLGAVLGIINTWHTLNRSRLKLKVLPAHAIPFGGSDPRATFSIEVTNLSEFAVTIREVGVFYEGRTERGALVRPILLDGGKWPRRLEPRTSVPVYGNAAELVRSGFQIRCAYAMTECGHTATGNSPALEQLSGKRTL